jgi:hypothetical protein
VCGPLSLFLLISAGAIALTGCNDSNDTPTSPTPGGLVVTSTRAVLRAGEVLPLTVTSAGTPVTTVTWTTTDSSVISVSPTGQATAGRAGRATVTATSGSSSGTLALRVVSDYAGTWAGPVARIQLTCTTGATSPLCVPGATTAGTLALRLTQIGDQVSGTLVDSAEPTATVPVTGQVQDDDQLALAGRVDVPATSPTLRVDITAFRATIDVTLATMSGSYTLAVDRSRATGGLQSDYRTQVQFRDLRR